MIYAPGHYRLGNHESGLACSVCHINCYCVLINCCVYLFEDLENKILVLESEKREWTRENEILVQKVKDLEDEAVVKNAKLLELGSMFLVPQVNFKGK